MKEVLVKKHFLLLVLVFGIGLITSCRGFSQKALYLSNAESKFNRGEYEEAIEYYDKVIELNENLDEAYSGKASCLEALGEYIQSLDCCNKALEENNNMDEAYNTKGNVLSCFNRFEEALKSYKNAFELKPEESLYACNVAYAYNSLEKYEEALEYSEKAIELNNNNDSAYVNKAYALESLGKISEALDCYDKSAEINPSEPICYINKGYLLENIGRSEEAIECFDKALEIDPYDLDTINSKGDSLNSLGEFEKAIDCFKFVLGKDSRNTYAHVSKSVSLYYQGKYTESIKACDKALRIDPDYSNAYIWKAKSLMESNDDMEKVRELCDKAISIDNPPFAYDTKGFSYICEHNYPKAIECFEQAIEADPSFKDSYINKIHFLYQQKKYSECIEFSNYGLEVFPDNQDILWYIGDCYSILLDSDKAIEYYKKALKIEPKTTSLLVSIAWEYFYLQDYDKATEYADKAKSISPDDETVLYLKSELQKQKLPDSQKIVNFIEENYLYFDKVNNFEQLAEQFEAKDGVNIDDISKFIDSVSLKDDLFTFFIHGDEYDFVKQEESISQIESKELESNIHYIKIKSFTTSISWEFNNLIDKIENPKDSLLVIDVRDNAGGVVSASTDILNYLLPECTTSYTVYRDGSLYSYGSDNNLIEFKKILVLVNEYSASSSEMLALGLKKHLNNVVIIGHPTVGKGVGQLVYEDKAKKYMIYLVSFYWNVMEENIMGKRIIPDVYVNGSSDSAYMKEIKRQASK